MSLNTDERKLQELKSKVEKLKKKTQQNSQKSKDDFKWCNIHAIRRNKNRAEERFKVVTRELSKIKGRHTSINSGSLEII